MIILMHVIIYIIIYIIKYVLSYNNINIIICFQTDMGMVKENDDGSTPY